MLVGIAMSSAGGVALRVRVPHMNEAWFTASSSNYGRTDDAFKLLQVARNASASEIKQAYRTRARELHPDVCADPSAADQFRALVEAHQRLQGLKPGSAQTHPCWDQLPEFYHHWAMELGHLTAEGLEEWITMMGLYDDEDLMLVNPARLDATGARVAAVEPAAAPAASGAAVAAEVAVAAEAAVSEPAGGSEPADDSSADGRMLEVLAYRQYMGCEQWRVRWAGDAAATASCESWERYDRLTTAALRSAADDLRAAVVDPDSPRGGRQARSSRVQMRAVSPSAAAASSAAAMRSRCLVMARREQDDDIDDEAGAAPKVNVASLIAYGLFLVYLSPIFIRAADKSGLVVVPPINTLTEIANNAADEAMAAGTLEIGSFFGYTLQGGTAYAQSVWRELLAEYYASGQSTGFLTEAGGVCARHAAWCAGVEIPP